jgi:zinc/manganese transport system substrate-binding protein
MKALLLLGIFLAATVAARAEFRIVCAENFYGSVAHEIAGDAATVTSILSNPNQDPHEFTTDAATAKQVADADVIIYSGLGYDDWMEKLLASGGKDTRIVIRVADLIGAKNGDNPHIWYDPRTMPALADKLYNILSGQFVNQESAFFGRAEVFKSKMKDAQDTIDAIKAKYAGTTVTATEPVFGYMAGALGFKMLNYEFQLNIMNDTEPTAGQTADFEKCLTTHAAKVLFYNSQVTDPTTERLKKLAQQAGVPIVGVTETQPTEFKTYSDWMNHELEAVQAGLKAMPH